MTKIEHDVVLFAQCVAAAFKSPQHPRTAHGGCAGGHRALHMAARVCFLREQHAGDAVFAMETRAPCASMPRDPIARVAARVATVKNCRKTHAFVFLTQDKKNIVHYNTTKHGRF